MQKSLAPVPCMQTDSIQLKQHIFLPSPLSHIEFQLPCPAMPIPMRKENSDWFLSIKGGYVLDPQVGTEVLCGGRVLRATSEFVCLLLCTASNWNITPIQCKMNSFHAQPAVKIRWKCEDMQIKSDNTSPLRRVKSLNSLQRHSAPH